MIQVDRARCCYCGGCVSVCPADALHLAEVRLLVGEECIECGACLSACPTGALSEVERASPVAQSWGDRLVSSVQHATPHGAYDVVVVGAGPGGSVAAWHAAQAGLSVLLLEKRQEIGSPVRCAEGVAHEALIDFIEPDPAWIAARVDRARIVASASGEVVQEWEGAGGLGYVLERRVFDRVLAQRAAQAGAEVRVKAAVTGLLRQGNQVCGVLVEERGRKYEVQAAVVIGADGVESRVGTWAGIDTQLPLEDTMVCVQYLLAGIDWDPGCLGYWIDEAVAPGGYAWVFPKGDGSANVGLGLQADLSGKTALDYLDLFIDGEPVLSSGRAVTLVAGNVPVSPPLPRPVTGGLLLVGDAARQVDPLTGGGIINAMLAGRLAAGVTAEALQAGDTSARALAPYLERTEAVFGRSLARNYRLRERFPPDQRASRSFVRLFAVAAGGK